GGAGLGGAPPRTPEPSAAGVGGCFFLQPADRSCHRWVMNRLYEGTGRYGSPFTPAMDAEARQAYAAHLTARSWDERGDELLDISWSQGDTLNVHAAQTWRQLDLPGQWLDLPPSRRGAPRGPAREGARPAALPRGEPALAQRPAAARGAAAGAGRRPRPPLPSGPPGGRRLRVHADAAQDPGPVRPGRDAIQLSLAGRARGPGCPLAP